MEGVHDVPELRGILPRTFRYIFDACDAAKADAETSFGAEGGEPAKAEYLVRASYLEIYNEEIRDLLSKNTGWKPASRHGFGFFSTWVWKKVERRSCEKSGNQRVTNLETSE